MAASGTPASYITGICGPHFSWTSGDEILLWGSPFRSQSMSVLASVSVQGINPPMPVSAAVGNVRGDGTMADERNWDGEGRRLPTRVGCCPRLVQIRSVGESETLKNMRFPSQTSRESKAPNSHHLTVVNL